MPTTTRSAASTVPSVRATSSTARGAAHLLHADAEPEPHAVVGVELTEHVADAVAQDALQRDGRGGDEHDVGADLPGRRRDLGTDPAGADHRHPARRPDGVAQPDGIVDAAQVADAAEVGAGHGEAARLGAGGQHGAVERERLTTGELEPARASVDRGDVSGHELDVVVVVEAVGVDPGRVRLGLAPQDRLRQRRPLVRSVHLVADEDHATPIAGVPCGLGCLRAGQAGADDDERCHPAVLSKSVCT